MIDANQLHQWMNAHLQAGNAAVSPQDDPNADDPRAALQLCARLLAPSEAPRFHADLTRLDTLFEDWRQHAETSGNPTAPRCHRQWRQALADALHHPAIALGWQVVVGGAFSAGKSRFLNRLLGIERLLPSDATPTTAIPTFLCHGPEARVEALNHHGQRIALDEQDTTAIGHTFTRRHGLGFAAVLRHLVIQRPDFPYRHLVFCDTPGYSKGDGSDHALAQRQWRRADYLIWLVDNQNGTLPQEDLTLLQGLTLLAPPLIVFTKADKRPRAEMERILQEGKRCLQAGAIEHFDVIGYSAVTGEEISGTGEQLRRYLEQLDQPRSGAPFAWWLADIWRHYLSFYRAEQMNWRSRVQVLGKLLLGDDDPVLTAFYQGGRQRLEALQSHLEQAESLRKQFETLLQELCHQVALPLSPQPTPAEQERLRRQWGGGDAPQTPTQAADTPADVLILEGHIDARPKDGCLTAVLRQDAHALSGVLQKHCSYWFVHLQLDRGGPIICTIRHRELQRRLGPRQQAAIADGATVQVQMIDERRCRIHIPLNPTTGDTP